MDTPTKRMAKLFNKSPLRKTKLQDSALQKRLSAQVEPLSEQKRVVSPQHWRFIHALVDGEGTYSLRKAAVAAGYDEKDANAVAFALTDPKKNPHIVAAIQQYRNEIAERYGTTIERHMRDLQIIRDKAIEARNYSAAVQAEYRRGQALGTIYVDRKEIRHGTIDSMSVEEVKKKLEEIKMLYGDPSSIIDVTPIAEDLVGEEAWREDYHESDELDDEEDTQDAETEPLPEPTPEPVKAKSIIDVMREAQVDKLAMTSKSKWKKS